ncbi:TPA: DUF2591 family protein [Escherichia coli]|nr:DUF2591 family protein [Escherichia coli]
MSNKLFDMYVNNLETGKKNDWNSADLETLSDYELNHLVGMVFYKDKKDIFIVREIPNKPGVIVAKDDKKINEILSLGLFDYCNKAEDAYPIMLAKGIGIRKKVTSDKWEASVSCVRKEDNYSYDIYAADKNPLRAAMMVYILKHG